MLAQQHIQDNAIDLVVDAVVDQGSHGIAGLPVAVSPTLALLMTGGVPGEVVVDHRIEPFLEVDALTQAVSADEHPLLCFDELVDALLALGRRQLAGDAHHLYPAQGLTKLVGEVVDGSDKPAEDDGVIPVPDRLLDDPNHGLELGIAVALQRFGCARHLQQSTPVAVFIRFQFADVATRRHIDAFSRLVFEQIEHHPLPDVVSGFFGLSIDSGCPTAQ